MVFITSSGFQPGIRRFPIINRELARTLDLEQTRRCWQRRETMSNMNSEDQQGKKKKQKRDICGSKHVHFPFEGVVCKHFMLTNSTLPCSIAEFTFAIFCEHPHIAKYYQQSTDSANHTCHKHFEEREFIQIMEEDCGSDLTHVQRSWTLEERVSVLAPVFFPIVCLCNQLLQNHLAHRDIKPDNICVTWSRREDQSVQIISSRLIDFGNLTSLRHLASHDCGVPSTYEYDAPESIIDNKLELTTDVWSLGMSMLNSISSLCIPTLDYTIQNNLAARKKWVRDILLKSMNSKESGSMLIPSWPDCIRKLVSSEFLELLRGMLIFDPKKRMTWQQVYDHPFFHTEHDKHKDCHLQIHSYPCDTPFHEPLVSSILPQLQLIHSTHGYSKSLMATIYNIFYWCVYHIPDIEVLAALGLAYNILTRTRHGLYPIIHFDCNPQHFLQAIRDMPRTMYFIEPGGNMGVSLHNQKMLMSKICPERIGPFLAADIVEINII